MILEYVYIHVLYLQYIHVTSNKSVQVVNLCFCTPRKHRAFGVTSPDITGTQINGSVYVDILSTLTLVKWYSSRLKSCTSWYVVYPIIYKGFINPSWCRISSINSIVDQNWCTYVPLLLGHTKYETYPFEFEWLWNKTVFGLQCPSSDVSICIYIYIDRERERCIYQCSWWRLGFWNVTGSVTCVSRLGGPPTRIKIVYFKIKSKGLFDAFSALNFWLLRRDMLI